MGVSYRRVFDALPRVLRRRINPLEFAIEKAVADAAEELSGVVVLDAGAGESRFAGCFSRHFYIALDSAVGDPSWDYTGVHIHADLAAIPLAKESVDLVVNTQVLEHVPDPEAVLRELGRVLKPGGRLLLTAPQGWHEHQQPHDFFRFTRFSLDLLLRRSGFSSVSIVPMGGYFHYLGHRLTYVPKVLFVGRKGFLRWFLFPLELACLVFFCFLSPLACYYLDGLDRSREFTLCYRVEAVK